jgi:hypothetical protein
MRLQIGQSIRAAWSWAMPKDVGSVRQWMRSKRSLCDSWGGCLLCSIALENSEMRMVSAKGEAQKFMDGEDSVLYIQSNIIAL